MGLICEPLGSLNCFPRRSKRRHKAPKEAPNAVRRSVDVPIPSEPFPFLHLPRELRDRIYHDLLTRYEHREIWIRYSVHRETWWDATFHCKCNGRKGFNDIAERLTLGLLKVNKQVHMEAVQTLYGRNKIWIDAPPNKTLKFLSRLPPVVREKIRYLKLWLDSYILENGQSRALIFSSLPDSEKARRFEHELLLPWQSLCLFISENLPGLHTLCMTRSCPIPFSEWGPEHPEPRWASFHHHGWMQAVRGMPSLRNLEVEVRVHFEGPWTVDGCKELRQNLDRESGFREKSVEWIYTFFQAGEDPYPSVFPAAMLMIHLSRETTNNGSAPSLGPDEEDAGERVLPPLPEFVQKHTYDDVTTIPVCTMGTGGPPRSPDNNR